MTIEYTDRWITCTTNGVEIRGYYFPWGTKRIPYSAMRSVRRVELSLVTGGARVWGTSNPRYWCHLDPRRPAKQTGLVLDLGHVVQPLITPDHPKAVEQCIRKHASDVTTADTQATIA